LAINFKQLFNFPWRSPVNRKTTSESIAQRKTQEILRNEVEQIQFELEEEKDFNRVETYKQQQLNIETQDSALTQQIQQGEITAAGIENEKRAKQNQIINSGLASAAQAVTQIARYNVATIGLRNGNYIQQERLQRRVSFGSQAIGIGISFAVNPILGATATAAFATNAILREFQTNLERQRLSDDNRMRMQLLGGISQRGNR
jgi:hypothetical protein